MLKRKLRDEEQWLKQYDKRQIDDELERMNKAHEDKALNDALHKKAHQTDILMQVGERDRAMRRDL